MSTEEFVSPPTVSAGQQLRQAREARGWAVSHVAGRLRIRPALVEALERDDYAPFGAVAYARGQLRNYAALLGVDAESVLQGVSAPRPDALGKLARNAPELHPRRPWLVRFGGAAVVLVLAVLGALWADANRERAPGVPVPAATSEGEQVSAPARPPADVNLPGPPAAAAPSSTESGAETDSPGPQAEASQAEAPAVAVAAVEHSAAAVPDGLAELRIQTRAVSWVEVSDGSGQRLIYELLSPGHEQAVRGVPPLRLLLGNAPAVEVIYNGAPVALPAGEHVVRMTLGSTPSTAPAPPVPQP